jgi:hypothetical protein
MDKIRGVPLILERGRQALGQTDLPVHPAQEQRAEIG